MVYWHYAGFYSLLASGDVYYWGTLEPIDQCKKGMKLLYSSKTESGPVLSLHGGLHYIVARCRGEDIKVDKWMIHRILIAALLIWGYYPGYSSNAELQPLKVRHLLLFCTLFFIDFVDIHSTKHTQCVSYAS